MAEKKGRRVRAQVNVNKGSYAGPYASSYTGPYTGAYTGIFTGRVDEYKRVLSSVLIVFFVLTVTSAIYSSFNQSQIQFSPGSDIDNVFGSNLMYLFIGILCVAFAIITLLSVWAGKTGKSTKQ